MGVPVVTLRSSPDACIHVQNVSSGLVTVVGHPELVADSPDMYIELASKLAADTDRIRSFRSDLRDNLLKSPLCDASRYQCNVETMFQSMWSDYCDGSKWPPNA